MKLAYEVTILLHYMKKIILIEVFMFCNII